MVVKEDDKDDLELADVQKEHKDLKPLYDFRRVLHRLPKLASTDATQAKRLLLGLHERFWHSPLETS